MNLTPRQRAYAALGILGALLLVLISPFVLGTDARHLSAFADGEEDASLFRAAVGQDAKALVATPHVLQTVSDPANTLLVVLGVERSYDASEARAIVEFLREGGRVLLVDETGYGNAITKEAGFAIAAQRVLDTRNHLGDPNLVDSQVRVGDESFRVLFNKPAHVVKLPDVPTEDFRVLATTSSAEYPHGSYADTDDDGAISQRDPAGPFQLAVSARVGEGTLVVVADTGPFMNGQMRVPEFDNDAFAQALVASLAPTGEDGTILIDESRHAPHAPLAPWNNAMRTLSRALEGDLAWVVLAVLFLGAVASWRFTRATQDWSHHEFDIGREHALPDDVRPDASRVQRFAQRRISENYNIPMEQVQAMTAEQLAAATGERTLAEAAAGKAKADPDAFFRTLTPPTEASQ